MGIGETITVINKSGKVVSSSKHIVNVFKEAKSAYRERKAEIKAERDAAAVEHKKMRDDMKALQLDDDTRSRTSRHSKATHRSSKSRRHHSRPPLERGYTDSFFANDLDSPRSPHARFEQDLAGGAREAHARELVRRNTEAFAVAAPQERTTRSRSESHIDMDLAYGEYIPPPVPAKQYDDNELREQASKLTRLLDEANCLQHSAVTTIENLQKNPDALAAVALTLAEISTMLGKMGPGVLLSFKTAFPAVVALLASPQFMIAAGVGVGVTVVALGGYKIIKKMQANKEEDRMLESPLQAAPAPPPLAARAPLAVEDSYQGLDELEPPELGRIEMWRRGIADVQASSQGTSVDGEFITPAATRHLVAEGVLDEDDIKSRRSTKSRHRSSNHHHHHRAESTSKSAKTRKSGAPGSTASGRSHTVKEKREKEPSLVKQLFRSRTVAY
ncbi:hypothetical protein DM02DRAFT_643711 [Periconia macrospinosa]|uniref:Uncharacterized protein n=1 Tax=Periconia macrospinosa TaxID=97972 RepID=A0A2V1DJC0_9PLEO|nr:hypothetical protein DM02DRAFT_643711 [Periconia macrospinosa]